MSHLTLIPGQSYPFTDHCGMMGFDGVYIGIARDEANYGPEILVFSFASGWKDDPPIRYAGCVASAHFSRGYNGEPDHADIVLTASYYGDTIEGLRHCTSERKTPRWEIRK